MATFTFGHMELQTTKQPKLPKWRNWDSPRQIYLDSNATCNLKCVQCDIHLLKNPPGELSHEERKQLIRDIGQWDPRIRLAFSGGEPFLRRKELYELAGLCREWGLQLGINTNGTLFKPSDWEQIPRSGISTLIFSVDSGKASIHDEIRGVPGTFKRVTSAIKDCLKAVADAGEGPDVLLTSILGAHNLGECELLVQLCKDLGGKALLFQPLQPTFEAEVQPQWWQNQVLWPQDPEQIHRGIDQLLSLKAAGAPLIQKKRDFEAMRHYFLQPDKLPPGQCLSMQNNLMIDSLGEVRFCFNQDRLQLPSLGNVRQQSIREIWENSRELRRQNQACSLECGAMLCHSR